MIDYKNLHVLEWSKKQNAFHIQPASDVLEKNLNALLNNEGVDYIPLMIGSRADCESVADRWRHRLNIPPSIRKRIREAV